MSLPSTRELLLAYDAQRERTLQKEMGMSALGRCRRMAGYMLAGTPPDPDFTENGVQAVMGTAIHDPGRPGCAHGAAGLPGPRQW
jgi:hypothetical protein